MTLSLTPLYLSAFALLLTSCGLTKPVTLVAQPNVTISGHHRAGTFALTRIELGFNGLPSKTFKKNEMTPPRATISFQGTGVLQAQWVLDGRVIEQLNVPLNRGSRLVLTPKLSSLITANSGRHVITLKVTQPNISFSTPKVIFYKSL